MNSLFMSIPFLWNQVDSTHSHTEMSSGSAGSDVDAKKILRIQGESKVMTHMTRCVNTPCSPSFIPFFTPDMCSVLFPCTPPPHQSFSETQKKRLLSWKQQVQRLFRSIPRKTLLDIAGYRQQRRYDENPRLTI